VNQKGFEPYHPARFRTIFRHFPMPRELCHFFDREFLTAFWPILGSHGAKIGLFRKYCAVSDHVKIVSVTHFIGDLATFVQSFAHLFTPSPLVITFYFCQENGTFW
jgi:hypothetical protein